MLTMAAIGLAVGAVIGTVCSAALPLAMAALGVVSEALAGVGTAVASLVGGATEVGGEMIAGEAVEMLDIVSEAASGSAEDRAGRRAASGAADVVEGATESASEVAAEGSATAEHRTEEAAERRAHRRAEDALASLEDEVGGGPESDVGADPSSSESAKKKGFKQRVADNYRELGGSFTEKLKNCVFSKTTKGAAVAIGLGAAVGAPMMETRLRRLRLESLWIVVQCNRFSWQSRCCSSLCRLTQVTSRLTTVQRVRR